MAITGHQKQALEALIDSANVSSVLGLIAEICAEQANRIRPHLQDREVAEAWDRAAAYISDAECSVASVCDL